MNKEEIWKDIPGYEGLYKVSNLGRVKSFKCKKEIILKPGVSTPRYLFVTLSKKSKVSIFYVHKLVAIAFLNHIPCGYKLVVNHKNCIRTDNRVENLEIITQRENTSKKHINSSSIYVGVCWSKKHKLWVSSIMINNKKIYLGSFENELDASNAYKNKLKEILT